MLTVNLKTLLSTYFVKTLRISNFSTSNVCYHVLEKRKPKPFQRFDPEWRKARGLPNNPNRERIMRDTPDFSYVDGRPTPYGSRHMRRILTQRYYAERIVLLTKEIDSAVQHHKQREEDKQKEIQSILDRKLVPKGVNYQPKDKNAD